MVIWTDTAISHITEFIDDARVNSENNVKTYINKLLDYVEVLDDMPKMGKNLEYIFDNSYEVRQLIYEKHRIIYHIKDKDIVILSVIHTRLDIDKALKELQRHIKEK